jgi:iron(III) transport system permease protein
MYGTFAIVVSAYFARFIPFTVRILQASMKQVDPSLEEAALLAVPSRLRVLHRVVGGLTRPGWWAAFFLGFVLCFRELESTLLVLPAGMETVPVKIYNYMHYGAQDRVAALCLLTAMVILLFGAGCRYGARRRMG